MWSDHHVPPALLSKQARCFLAGEIEERLQTQRDMVENRGEGQGAPKTQPHIPLSRQKTEGFLSGEHEEPQRKGIRMLAFVCKVLKTNASSKSVLSKEGSSANHPTMHVEVSTWISVPHCQIQILPVERHLRRAGDVKGTVKMNRKIT